MRKLLVTFLSLTALVACNNDDDDYVQPINHSVSVIYDENFGDKIAEGVSIRMTNRETSTVYVGTTDANGVATIEVRPGVYSIQASISLSVNQMSTLFGLDVEEETAFNVSVENQTVNATQNETTELVLSTGRIGNLLIKQVYYTGSHVTRGAVYRDQFFEIVNNSNETLYLDGLCFAQLTGSQTIPSTLQSYHLANGQFDWSQAEGLTDQGQSANTDYVYSDEVTAFPGTGTQYPIEPGEAVIIAATALNHKAPLTVDGTTYEVADPSLTIDLSKARFEVYFGDYPTVNPLDSDVDTPAINMEIRYKKNSVRDLILDPLGRDAYAIFYATQAEIDAMRTAPLPSVSEANVATAIRHLQIPNSLIIDGIEIQNFNDNRPKPKRLPDAIDAGQIKASGSYTSESAIRKVKTTIGNRTIYVDTNNSTNDFEIIFPDTSSLN